MPCTTCNAHSSKSIVENEWSVNANGLLGINLSLSENGIYLFIYNSICLMQQLEFVLKNLLDRPAVSGAHGGAV